MIRFSRYRKRPSAIKEKRFTGPAGTKIATGTITRAASAAGGKEVIDCGFEPAFVMFAGVDDRDENSHCDGWDDGIIHTAGFHYGIVFFAMLIAYSGRKLDCSILIQNLTGEGHKGYISAKSSTGFTITWTRLGAGKNITVRYVAVK